MAGNICCCGSNKTCFRIFLLIHIMYAAAMVLLWGAQMTAVQSLNEEDLIDAARSENVVIDLDRPGQFLSAARGISTGFLIVSILELLLAICGTVGEFTNSAWCLVVWGVYLTLSLAFTGCGLIFGLILGREAPALSLVFPVVFLGFSLALTQRRWKEMKMEAGRGSSEGQMYVFSGGAGSGSGGHHVVVAVDGAAGAAVTSSSGAWAVYPEAKDLPPKYSDIGGAKADCA